MVRKKTTSRYNSQKNNSINPPKTARRERTVVLVDKNRTKRARFLILRQIKELQRSTKLLIPRAPFARVVKQIINELFPTHEDLRIQSAALEALQESVEMYLVNFFQDSFLLSLHTGRVTLMQKDMILLRRLRGRNDIINK